MKKELYIVEGDSRYFDTEEEAKKRANQLAFSWFATEISPRQKMEVYGDLQYGYGSGKAAIKADVYYPSYKTPEEIEELIKEYKFKCTQYQKFVKTK